jgi:hypothetical protein
MEMEVMEMEMEVMECIPHLSMYMRMPLVLFDELGVGVPLAQEEEEEIYPDEHYTYYDDMFQVNGVDYY